MRKLWSVLIILAAVKFIIQAAEFKEGAGHEYDNIKLGDTIHSDSKELPAELTVEPASVIRSYDAVMFGLSYDNYGNDILAIAKDTPGQSFPVISTDFLKAAEAVPLPLNRVFFTDDFWKTSTGPLAQRQKFKPVSWTQPKVQVCGPSELIKAILAVDHSAKFDIMVELTDKTPALAGEIAEFLTGGDDTPWGRKRIESGIKNPVMPVFWELGNERDWSSGKITITEYIRLSKATIAAVRKVQPDAKFAVHVATAPWAAVQAKHWKEWHRTLLMEMAGDISYFAVHPYYHGYSLSYLENYLNVIRDDIAASSNPKIKIFVSEHGKWPGGDSGSPSWKKTWHTTHALVGCLDVAEWLIRMLDRPEICAMTMHACSSGPWGMFYNDKSTGKPYATGLADLFRFFKLVPFGGKVVKSRLSGDGTSITDGKLSLSAAAVLGPDGRLYILIDNRLPDTRRSLKFNLPGGPWKLERRYLFTGPEMESVNTLTDRPLGISYFPGNLKELQNADIPGRSLNLLVLSR